LIALLDAYLELALQLDQHCTSSSSWLCLLSEVLRITPPYFTMGEALVEISSHVHYHQMDRASSKWYLLDAYLELALRLDQHCTSSSSFIMMMSWECIWELTVSYSSRHTLYRLNSLMTNLRISPWITPWSSYILLYFQLLTILKPTYGSSIVYGQVLQI
jgi:hypothetical protein